jgi:hypothetical protein
VEQKRTGWCSKPITRAAHHVQIISGRMKREGLVVAEAASIAGDERLASLLHKPLTNCLSVLWIRDGSSGSGLVFYPGFQIQNKKEEWEKIFSCFTFFVVINFTKFQDPRSGILKKCGWWSRRGLAGAANL